jgi:NitT/TauT family transport system substrate-binding protein
MIETQGLGEKHGIVIERHEFSGPPAHYLQITGDVSDIAAATWLELQQNQARGLRVVGVGPNLRYVNPMVVGVNSGIESIEDLKGKRIAVYFQAGTDVLAARAAIQQKYGFDFFTENDVTSADAPLLSTQLERGDVDAILTFSNFAAALVAEGKGRILFVVADLLNEVFGVSKDAPFGVYITSANVANNYPERIERFLAAYLDAVDILVTDDSVWPALAESRGITDPAQLSEFMESERQGFATEWNDSVFDGFEEMFNTLLAIGGQDVVGLPEFDATTYTTDFWPGG